MKGFGLRLKGVEPRRQRRFRHRAGAHASGNQRLHLLELLGARSHLDLRRRRRRQRYRGHEDAWLGPRLAGNPFLREQNIRFYAGAPLKTSDGSAIGSLCIIDHRPRRITERDRQLLALMADTVMAEVEARALAREHAGWETRGPDAASASRAANNRANRPGPSCIGG